MANIQDMAKTFLKNVLAGTLVIPVRESTSTRTYWNYTVGIGNSTADNLVAAAVAGKRHYITGIQYGSGAGPGSISDIIVKSAATVLWRRPWCIAAGVFTPTEPVFAERALFSGVNEALYVALSVGNSAGTTYVNIQGYTE